MSFAWDRMDRTPAGKVERNQQRSREGYSLEALADQYGPDAVDTLEGKREILLRPELSRFANEIMSKQGFEQEEALGGLVDAIKKFPKANIFGEIPDAREQKAFALALLRQHLKTVQ